MNREDRFQVSLLSGAEAEAALWCGEREKTWRDLCARSPSSTVFQGPDFARAWWRAYSEISTLVISQAHLADGSLIGQFLLVRVGEANWAAIGTHQCEYPAVLALADDPVVVAEILRLVRRGLGVNRLSFLYLPPNSPVQGYIDGCRASYMRPHARALRHFKDAVAPSKNTRTKQNKLRKMGARCELLRDPARMVEFLAEFIPLRDAGQLAKGRNAPFLKDPRKRTFHEALAGAGLLHAATMRIEDRLISTVMGIPSGSHLVLYGLAFDQTFKDLRPVVTLIHELTALYAGTHIETLDLTPGGSYKDRFATTYDTAYTIDIAWSLPAVVEVAGRRCARHIARCIRACSKKNDSIGAAM